MKILFTASECYPFAVSGGLGDVIAALPKALAAHVDIRVVLPLYDTIPDAYRSMMRLVRRMNVRLAWRNQECGIYEYRVDGVVYYFLENPYYFHRNAMYEQYDDGERFAFFCHGVFALMRQLDFVPDVLHAHDWHTALIPVLQNLIYGKDPYFCEMRTLFTIHNVQYQGIFDRRILSDVFGISDSCIGVLEYDGCLNLMKGAICCADRINTVSPSYAEEILDPYFACGLAPVLSQHKEKLCGILNGIDTVRYNPETDAQLFDSYTVEDRSGKKQNKKKLRRLVGLSDQGDVPLVGIVSRLADHKGFDLIRCVFRDLMTLPIQMVLLGKGDTATEAFFESMAREYHGKFAAMLTFDSGLASKIYGGSDLILMPSRSEPCGLVQMVALRYGAVPIVRETGGLRDSVSDVKNGGNGFTFSNYNAHDMLHTVERAAAYYSERSQWDALVGCGMCADLSWDRPAKAYLNLYRELSGIQR